LKRLYKLEPAEVSLVNRGANKKKFLIYKSDKGAQMTKQELEAIAKGDPAALKKVEQVLKEYNEAMKAEGEEGADEKQMTALKAVVRILTPFKDSLPSDLLDQVMEAAGLGGPSDGGQPEEGDVEKLGENFKKDPAQPMQKSKDGKKLESDEDDEDDEDEDDDNENEGEKEMAKKSAEAVLKADGTLDLSAVPESLKPTLEILYKGQQDAIKKAADLEQKLEVERTNRVTKEFNEKAAGFKHIGADKDKVAAILKSTAEKNPEQLAALEEVLKGVDAQVATGDLYKELGSGLQSSGKTTYEMIEKAAEGFVQKSGQTMTKEAAVAEFLNTKEGQKMYAQHQAERGGI
jgi:hypothetical protein